MRGLLSIITMILYLQQLLLMCMGVATTDNGMVGIVIEKVVCTSFQVSLC